MDNIIYVEPIEGVREFSTYCFYNSFLPKVQMHYQNNRTAPIFSFEKLHYINPLVLPNLLGIGQYLKMFHDKPIELKLNYNPQIIYYLDKLNFFKICEKPTAFNPIGLNIFNFDDRYLGGYSSFIEKEQRVEHKIQYYRPIFENDEQSMSLHDELHEDLTLFTLPHHFGRVLRDSIPEEYIYESIESIAEPISNGILHSESITWGIAQTTPKPYSKTLLSISDIGIGFEASLKKNNPDQYIIKRIKQLGLYKENLRDFYYTMEALFYSLIKDRFGLIDFIFKITEEGTVRIHYNSTQILFTPRIILKASNLKKVRKKIYDELEITGEISEKSLKDAINGIIDLSQTLLSFRSNDRRYSAIRIFDVIFRGVHIEFQLPIHDII